MVSLRRGPASTRWFTLRTDHDLSVDDLVPGLPSREGCGRSDPGNMSYIPQVVRLPPGNMS